MAFRRDIIDAVYTSIQDVATGTYTVTDDDGTTDTLTITDSDVLRTDPDNTEVTPALYIDFGNETPVEYNGVGSGPDYIDYNDNGTVNYAEWREYVEMDVFVTPRGRTRVQKEPLYRSVRRYLGRYTDGDRRPHELQSDINDIEIDTTVPADSTETDDAIWGDQIQLYVEYVRRYIVESGGSMTMDEAVDAFDNIAEINITVDADTLYGYNELSYDDSSYDSGVEMDETTYDVDNMEGFTYTIT